VSRFENLTAANIPGAQQVRVVTLTEDEIFARAREAFIFAHPGAPLFVRRLARSGRLDWFLASARQAMRDIEKPVDLLTHEARAAWVLNMHSPLIAGLPPDVKAAVAQVAVTAIRVGTKDAIAPPHAVIHAGLFGPAALALTGVALAIVAIAECVL
jgi:hypothetical protein